MLEYDKPITNVTLAVMGFRPYIYAILNSVENITERKLLWIHLGSLYTSVLCWWHRFY